MKELTLTQWKALKYQFRQLIEGKEEHFGDFIPELEFFAGNTTGVHNDWVVSLSGRQFDQLTEEFNIYCAESGRAREACFDGEAQERELYEYISDELETERWHYD